MGGAKLLTFLQKIFTCKRKIKGAFVINEEKLRHLGKKKKKEINAKNAIPLITAHLISRYQISSEWAIANDERAIKSHLRLLILIQPSTQIAFTCITQDSNNGFPLVFRTRSNRCGDVDIGSC